MATTLQKLRTVVRRRRKKSERVGPESFAPGRPLGPALLGPARRSKVVSIGLILLVLLVIFLLGGFSGRFGGYGYGYGHGGIGVIGVIVIVVVVLLLTGRL
jgi:hypothetical protein